MTRSFSSTRLGISRLRRSQDFGRRTFGGKATVLGHLAKGRSVVAENILYRLVKHVCPYERR